MGDTVPLIDAQTANILGSINKFTVQQHVKVFDNCIEQPNTYTIYNLETNQALIRVQERSECCPRICCAPHHSIILEFNALDPANLRPVVVRAINEQSKLSESTIQEAAKGGCVVM